MPCKHEGGTDACIKYKNQGRCKVVQRQYSIDYIRTNVTQTPCPSPHHRGLVGASGELLVRFDLCRRGYEVTVPANPTAKHDLHVELPSRGWVGVQVKVGRLNTRTGVLRSNRASGASPIFACVHPATGRIDYLAGTEELPPELL